MNFFHRSLLLSALFLSPLAHQIAAQNPPPAVQPGASLGQLLEALNATSPEKSDKEAALSLCDQILARDVIADFVNDGTAPLEKVVRKLRDARELGTRVETWKEELEENPKSERLNYLLAVASRYGEIESPNSGRMNFYPPVRIRITRKGWTFTGEYLERGRWEKLESAEISMPRKALIGLVGNATTGKFKAPELTVGGVPVPNPQWQPAQISRTSTRGHLETSGETLQLTGAGFKPSTEEADDLFFASRELDGDGTLEVGVEEIGAANRYGGVGIMIRGSLDPSAPFAAMMVERREGSLYFWSRAERAEAPGYLTALCALRPHDVAFVAACLREMLAKNMNEAAYQAAERLLRKEPTAFLTHFDLFQEVFSNSDRLARLSELVVAMPAPRNAEEGYRIASACQSLADLLQDHGEHAGAVALWRKMEESTPGAALPLETRQKRLISYSRLNRPDDAAGELKRIFLGPEPNGHATAPAGMGSPVEQLLSSVSLGDPCLVPLATSFVHLAVHHGVAPEIFRALEKQEGPQKAAAKAVALALRLAARDPATLEAVEKGTYAARLPRELPEAGLALIAFELQQFDKGRPAALSVLKKMIDRKPDARFPRFDRTALLEWRARLTDFQADKETSARAVKDLAEALRKDRTPDDQAFNRTLQRLLRAGDAKQAALVAENYGRSHPNHSRGAFDSIGDVFDLLDLYEAKSAPMPVIWTTPAGDGEVEVHWECGVDNWGLNLTREVRVLGAPLPALDKRYALQLYAIRGAHHGGSLPDDDRIAVLPEVASTGKWTGKIPAGRRWLAVVLQDGQGKKTRFSPSVPAALGKNLLSPIEIEAILNKQGDWTGSQWIWGSPLRTEFPKNGLFLSRMEPGRGEVVYKHRAIPIDPSQDYVFSGWLKTDNGRGEAGYSVVFFDAQNTQVAEWKGSVENGGRWTLMTFQFGGSRGAGILSLPPSASSAEVRLVLGTQCEIGDVGLYCAPKEK